MRTGVLGYGYSIDAAEVNFIPITPIRHDEAGLDAVAAVVSKLEDLDEVVTVYPNSE